MKTLSISEYFKVSKESDECGVKVKVEEKPDTSLSPKPHAVMDKTESELEINKPNKKPLDGQDLEPNLDIEFNTTEDKIKTGAPLEGGDEVDIEKVCQESDSLANHIATKMEFLDTIQEEMIALESEIPLQLQLLSNPEKVTHSDAMLAAESLKNKLKLLKIPAKNSKALNVITCESLHQHPASDLLITVEDEKTLLQKLKDTILKVYKWIKDMIMKGINYIAGIKDRMFSKKVEERVETIKEKVTETVAASVEFKTVININHPLVTITASAGMSGYDVNKYYDDRTKILSEIDEIYSAGIDVATKALNTKTAFDLDAITNKVEEQYKRLDSLTRELLKAAHYERSVTSKLKSGQYLYNITLDNQIHTLEIQDKVPTMLPVMNGKDFKPDQDVTFNYETVIANCELSGKNATEVKNMTVTRLREYLNELKDLEEKVENTPESDDVRVVTSLKLYKEKIDFLKKEIQTSMVYPAKYMNQTMRTMDILDEAIRKADEIIEKAKREADKE